METEDMRRLIGPIAGRSKTRQEWHDQGETVSLRSNLGDEEAFVPGDADLAIHPDSVFDVIDESDQTVSCEPGFCVGREDKVYKWIGFIDVELIREVSCLCLAEVFHDFVTAVIDSEGMKCN
jgi:hypothetical protein